MSGYYLRAYGVALDGVTSGSLKIRIKLRQADSDAFADNTHWTPAAGDVRVSKDFGAAANIGTLPTYVNGWWEVTLSAAELTAKQVGVTIDDAAVVPEAYVVETYGNASAMYAPAYTNGDSLGLSRLDATVGSRASQTTADAIKLKTDLIRPGGVAAVSSVSSSGKITVREGFDYSADGGSAEITITEPEVGAWDADLLTANSFRLYARHVGVDDDLDVAATLNAPDVDGLRSFDVSILRTDLPSRTGQYKYHVYGVFTGPPERNPEVLTGTFELARGRLVA